MASLSIAIRSAPRPVAPAGLWVEAVDLEGFDVPGEALPGQTYDPGFHEITFLWTVEGAPLSPYTAPANMPPEWRDANRAYGKIAALFFADPGQYTLSVQARDRSGTLAEARQQITVQSGESAYPGSATICVSSDPAETWEGAPVGAVQVGDVSEIEAALHKTRLATRLLFRRGQDYRGISLRINKQRLAHIDAWGTGDRPVLRPAPGSDGTMFALWNRATQDQVTVANIAFQGAWNAATETGGDTASPLTWAQSRTPCHYAVWNCVFDGFERLNFQPRASLDSCVLVGNSVVTNWRNYGFLFDAGAACFALVGMQVAQHAEALHGDRKAGALSNNHGPLRLADCAKLYIGASDFFSRSGWSELAGEPADQPCLRLNTRATRGRRFNLERITCEGGSRIINLDGATGQRQETPGNYLIDKAILIATAKTIGPFVDVDFGGATLRNILGVLPDTPRRHPNAWPGALRTDMDQPSRDNITAPYAVFSSSFINLLRGRNRVKGWKLEQGASLFQNVTLENNLTFAADQKNDVVFAPMLAGITPRFRGVRYNFRHQRGQLVGPVHPGESFLVPYHQISEARVDQKDGPATSQAYWERFADRDRWHMLYIQKLKGTRYAERGDFSVRFERQGARLTNQSAEVWPGGARWVLSLDRTSRLAAMDVRYASPETLPLPQPAVRAGARDGRVAEDDLFLNPRGPAPSKGAVESG